MAPERADRVLRTARMEPAARPEERAHRDAVRLDEDDQRCLHASDNVFQCFSSEPRRTVPVSRSAVARATTTRSSPASRSWFSRKLSRTSRFKRLRRFARRTRFFATAIPSRAGPALRARARTEKFRSDERTGSSNTRWKSCRVRSRRSPPNERSRSSVRRSGREARPALGSPRLDDPPPRARAHLGAEATTAFRTANAWLKRSLHPVRTTVWAGGSARAAKDTDGGGKFQRARTRPDAGAIITASATPARVRIRAMPRIKCRSSSWPWSRRLSMRSSALRRRYPRLHEGLPERVGVKMRRSGRREPRANIRPARGNLAP